MSASCAAATVAQGSSVDESMISTVAEDDGVAHSPSMRKLPACCSAEGSSVIRFMADSAFSVRVARLG